MDPLPVTDAALPRRRRRSASSPRSALPRRRPPSPVPSLQCCCLSLLRRLQSGLEGIGSSRQAEARDGVQIAAMSDQIAKLTAALAESERRRVVEQESMSKTIQQIKEQVMNLAR
ncbi:hypothetical protein MTR67_050634 [Solanum verrucosum]|uniref:Uncharacterized protein n=1 Tax=Solanum verrucosum TaxID=315347 RepID=A0AAF0V4T3_SOLVR|nr:hypothetical protein MTR67_050634 [Solanum verrucosum]